MRTHRSLELFRTEGKTGKAVGGSWAGPVLRLSISFPYSVKVLQGNVYLSPGWRADTQEGEGAENGDWNRRLAHRLDLFFK